MAFYPRHVTGDAYLDLRPEGREQPCEVLLGDEWIPGDVLVWRRHGDGPWQGWVEWSRGPGQPNHLDWFEHPAALRELQVEGG